MRSGFVDFFNNFFVSQKRDEFVRQAQETKERIAQSKLSAAKKKIFQAVIDYALAANNNSIVNFISKDSDVDQKRALLNQILALSKVNDDVLLKEANILLQRLPQDSEPWKSLTKTVSDASIELEQRRDMTYKIAGAMAAVASVVFTYFNPIKGSILIATEIAVAYTQDLARLKPYLNEAREIVECGLLLEAVVDGLDQARENLAMNTFKR